MKLIVQIPVYNEEETIGEVIKSIPKKLPHFSRVEILVADDGSTDKTARVAKRAGADYVISNRLNRGLARTFRLALQKSLDLGADIIVNTDGDSQYDQKEIPKLIEAIILKKADMVIGDRQIKTLTHMPRQKKIGNIMGSWMVRRLTGVRVRDASSGFRAFSRRAAESFYLLSNHTYTHETIIQAANKDFVITEVPVTFRKRQVGESRLINGVWRHIKRSSATIIRAVLMYKAFKYLVTSGLVVLSLGMVGVLRYLYFFALGESSGHVQSLIVSSVLVVLGFNTVLLGIIADLISINRKLLERK